MSKKFNSILEAIGHTPLIKLQKLGKNYRPELWAKCEFFNPGGSMKDRVGLHLVEKAEKSGALKPGGTIVEATSGNTGTGLAIAGIVKGYKTIFTCPDKVSKEKVDQMRAFGAKVVVCPTNVEADDPNSYYSTAKKIAEETENSFYANQYFNPDNPEAHYLSTGPEIWEQTEGQIQALIAGVGTGGSISGIGKFLKEKNPEIKIIGIDPIGSILTHYHQTGELIEAHSYITEGIGEDIIPSNINFDVIDEFIQTSDVEAAQMTRTLLLEEAIYAGFSCGAAMAGALKWAEKQTETLNTVILLPDSGSRYLSKVYNDDWMKEKGLL